MDKRGLEKVKIVLSIWIKNHSLLYWIELTYHILYAILYFSYGLYMVVDYIDKHFPVYGPWGQKMAPGWIAGRMIDKGDVQYSVFRELLPLIIGATIVFVLIDHLIAYLSSGSQTAKLAWHTTFGLSFVLFTSEATIFYPIVILLLNFAIARTLGASRAAPVVTWVFNCSVLVFMEFYGNNFSFIHPSLSFLDKYHGIFKWNSIPYTFILRTISFNMDYYWMLTQSPPPVKGSPFSYYSRQETSGKSSDYSLLAFFGYGFYFPTWACGPNFTFNAYISQVKHPQQTYSNLDLVMYCIRWLLIYLLKELMDHYLPLTSYTAYIFSTGIWKEVPLPILAMISYWTLKSIYLKFLIIWRLFRISALVDGIETPENMNRCMSNNFTVSGFWRSWHRSFNQWLIRYIYVPLGGSKISRFRTIINVFLVFSFVVFAHAPSLVTDPQILVWGWSMALFMVPEKILSAIFDSRWLKPIKTHWCWRHLVAAGGALMVVILILANLCGYGMTLWSHDKSAPVIVWELVNHLFFQNWSFFLLVWLTLFSGVHLMLIVREWEEYVGMKKEF